jgi:phospholipid/cholesterol/gamma-HCH transport system substrate-binding protein
MRRVVVIGAVLAALALVLFGQAAGGGGGSYEIRGIFDNGGFLVTGEQVRVAGATVGTVSSVGVTRPGDWANRDHSAAPGKAVVVMKIDDPAFQDFRRDATCLIRPQSLLGEKYVDCQPTRPRAPGTQPPPPLAVVPDGQPGAGQHFLPLQNNGKEVDLDLVQNIMREPFADRFRLILNNLGAGLAARGQDLEAIIRRADPALRETDQVLAELARENRQLSQLAADSDTILAPLARERQHVAGFINNANATAEATAERSRDLEAGLQRFPGALHALRLTMVKLRAFSTQATPVFADFRAGAPAIARATKALGPFAHAATPALVTLGSAAQQSQGPIVKSDPILRKTRDLAQKAAPGAKSLARLLASLRKTDGFKKLTSFLFNTVGSINGFDQYGHFLRAGLQFTPCTQIVAVSSPACVANWGSVSSAKNAPAPTAPKGSKRASGTGPGDFGATSASAGKTPGTVPLPLDAHGDVAGGTSAPGTRAGHPATHGPSIGAVRDLLDAVVGRPQARSSGGGP